MNGPACKVGAKAAMVQIHPPPQDFSLSPCQFWAFGPASPGRASAVASVVASWACRRRSAIFSAVSDAAVFTGSAPSGIAAHRGALRRIRSAPLGVITPDSITCGEVVAALANTQRRGRCDAAIAGAYHRAGGDLAARLAGHRFCPPAVRVMAVLNSATGVADSAFGVCCWRARRPPDPRAPRWAHTFLLHSDGHVFGSADRVAVAGSGSAPDAVLWRLAGGDEPAQITAVAKNPSCPAGALALFCVASRHSLSDYDASSHRATENLNCPPVGLAAAAGSEYSGIRYRVAVHPNTPAKILAALGDDPSTSVREAACVPGRSAPVGV